MLEYIDYLKNVFLFLSILPELHHAHFITYCHAFESDLVFLCWCLYVLQLAREIPECVTVCGRWSRVRGIFELEVITPHLWIIPDIFYSGIVFRSLHTQTGLLEGVEWAREGEGEREREREGERRIADIGTITLHFCVIWLWKYCRHGE